MLWPTTVSLCLISPYIVTALVLAVDTWEQRPNTVRSAAVTLPFRGILLRLNLRLKNTSRPCSRNSLYMGTYTIQASKVGEMQLLVFLNSFECEEGENAFILCFLVEDYIFHPTIWQATMVLHTKSARRRGTPGGTQTKNRVN